MTYQYVELPLAFYSNVGLPHPHAATGINLQQYAPVWVERKIQFGLSCIAQRGSAREVFSLTRDHATTRAVVRSRHT